MISKKKKILDTVSLVFINWVLQYCSIRQNLDDHNSFVLFPACLMSPLFSNSDPQTSLHFVGCLKPPGRLLRESGIFS